MPTPTAGTGDEDCDSSGKPDKDKSAKATGQDKTPEVAITLKGVLTAGKDAEGNPGYQMAWAGKTYQLEAGPSWFWGAKNPLKPFVGKTVTIVGETHTGSTEIDVQTVDGKAIRAPGKPPWAGGWKVVGPSHPGWSQAKADREKAKAERKAAKAAGKPATANGKPATPDKAEQPEKPDTECATPGS